MRTRAGVMLSICSLASCVSQDPAHWQRVYPEAFLNGYAQFRAHASDTDLGMAIFSYTVPAGREAGDLIPRLRQQLRGLVAVPLPEGELGTASPCFVAIRETATELHLWCKSSPGGPSGTQWRVLMDPARQKVTAMFVNVGADERQDLNAQLEQLLRAAHAE